MKTPLACLALLASSTAIATPKVPRDQLVETIYAPAQLNPALPSPESLQDDALAQMVRIASFEQKMQWATPCVLDGGTADAGLECNFGGVIEVESGMGMTIIESDNTHEAIWDWGFLHQTNGAGGFDSNWGSAFDYLSRYPGYLEWQDGGGTGPDYYSIYNCGWGMRAVLQYEAATGDQSHHAYGEMCAQHVTQYALPIVQASQSLVDQGTAGWAASGLWMWGDANANSGYKQTAAQIGAQVKAWLDAFQTRPASTTWAISGGAAFYGVVNSYMKEHPAELLPWVQKKAPLLGGWIDESNPLHPPPGLEWTDWRNAWAEWNMLAQFTAARVLDGNSASDAAAHRQVALDIYGKLVAQDTDMDGGIPGSQQRPATEDQSWITSYLAYFGIREVLALQPPMPDGGASDLATAPPPMQSSGCALSTGRAGLALAFFALALFAVAPLARRSRRRR